MSLAGCKGLTEGDCQRLAHDSRPGLSRVREHLSGLARALPTQDFTRGRDDARAFAEELAGDLAALEQVDPRRESLRIAWGNLTGELVQIRLVLGNIANAYEGLRVDASDGRSADELKRSLDELRGSLGEYAKAGQRFDALCR